MVLKIYIVQNNLPIKTSWRFQMDISGFKEIKEILMRNLNINRSLAFGSFYKSKRKCKVGNLSPQKFHCNTRDSGFKHRNFHSFANQGWIQNSPWQGTPTLQSVRQNMILPNFLKNCMKLRKF